MRPPRSARARVVALSTLLTAAAGLTVFGMAQAQTSPPDERGEVSRTPDGRAILHRRLPTAAGARGQGPIFLYDPVRGGSLPRELLRDGQSLPTPRRDTTPAGGEAVYAEAGVLPADGRGPDDPAPSTPEPTPTPPDADPDAPPAPPASPARVDPRRLSTDAVNPDRATQMEGRLDYHAVFDPSIVPFKRNRAFDGVGADYTLQLRPSTLTELRPVGNQVDAGREVFWGSLLVDGRAGVDVPLPSVSPDSRILSAETVPDVGVRFFKDGADNYYVRAATDGRFRLVFVMDAPTRYFGRELPTNATLRDVPRDMQPAVPDAVGRAARTFASTLGVSARTPYDVLVGKLVAYFRAFEPGDPPASTEDIYLDLATGRKGVCRHRTFALVVTALGLGLPARYVYNEAHVFAELWVPGDEPGWLRVDLGGGAEELVVHAGQDKVRHRPRTRDPFDRPDAYARQIAGDQAAGAMRTQGMPPATRRRPGTPPAEPSGDDGLASRLSRLLDARVRRAVPDQRRPPTRTSLSADASLLYRGDKVELTGQVVDNVGRPVTQGQVQLLLVDDEGRAVALLGVTALGADGRYAAELALPDDQRPGRYDLVAEFTGTPAHGPSVSD